jgi:hypothetical protein
MNANNTSRRYLRYKGPKPVLVAWMYGSQRTLSSAKNLSLGGLFIVTPAPPPLGVSLKLLFNTPEGEVRVRGVVRSVTPGRGMGLAIVSMEQEHRARLSRWFQHLEKESEAPTPSL